MQICAGAALVAAWSGCSKHPEPPFERMELVARFFRSVRNGEFDAAAQQGRKLYTLDRNNSFLLHLVTIHESNVYLRRAQKALNSGDVNGALKILDEGRKRYPDNRTVGVCYSKVLQLRNAKKLIAAMEKAQSSAAMSASLTAATTGLGANMTPDLARYFKRYEARINATAARERSEAEKAESLMPPPQNAALPTTAATPEKSTAAPAAAGAPPQNAVSPSAPAQLPPAESVTPVKADAPEASSPGSQVKPPMPEPKL